MILEKVLGSLLISVSSLNASYDMTCGNYRFNGLNYIGFRVADNEQLFIKFTYSDYGLVPVEHLKANPDNYGIIMQIVALNDAQLNYPHFNLFNIIPKSDSVLKKIEIWSLHYEDLSVPKDVNITNAIAFYFKDYNLFLFSRCDNDASFYIEYNSNFEAFYYQKLQMEGESIVLKEIFLQKKM